jgi:hypothetical protein
MEESMNGHEKTEAVKHSLTVTASAVLLSVALTPAGLAAGKRWPRRFADVALPADKLPKVVATHPRLWVRAKPWKYGLSVDELRKRAKEPNWARRFAKPPRGGEALALHYLATGDESVVPKIVEGVINRRVPGRYGQYETVKLDPAIVMYDWVCSSKKVAAEQKKAMQAVLLKIARVCIGRQQRIEDFMHHQGAGTCALNLLAVALALHGDHPDAPKLLAQALGFVRATYLPAYQHAGGVWQGGGVAYFTGRAEVIPWIFYLWASGTHEDVFDIIRREYGNWFEDMTYFFIYHCLPDGTRSDLTGFDRAARHFFPGRRNFMVFAAATRSPDAYAFLRWADKPGRLRKRIGRPEEDFLLYDPRVDKLKPAFPDRLPKAKLWGRSGAGYVQFRHNGWRPDATIVEFKCGDHIWSHTHNANQNGFTIFHKGRLAIQTGTYSDNTYFGAHTRYYYARTVSCNGMLIIDPQEFSWASNAKKALPEADAEGCYKEYGGQRLIRGSCNTFTFPQYLARKTALPSERRGGKAFQHWETGDIVAFDHAPDYSWSYVCGDATQAYNNPKRVYGLASGRKNRPKTDLCTRSLVLLDGTDLLVFDRVNALDPGFRKAWLLHSQAKPEIGGKLLKAEVPGHIEDFDGDTVTVTWGDSRLPRPDPKDPARGRLWVRTLLPAKHVIRRIGGAGYEFWVNGKNRPPGKRGAQFPDKPDDGNWRVEISPAEPAKFDVFLHSIHIGDTAIKKAPEGTLVPVAAGAMKGIALRNWVVLFGEKGTVRGEVRYRAPAGSRRHLVLDLLRGATYKLTGPGGEKTVTASKEGALHFEAPAGAAVTLKPVKDTSKEAG